MEAKHDSTGQQAAAFTYTPGRTLGRSGFTEGPADRLYVRANQLDALLALMSGADEESGMQAFNPEIQRTLLELASSLAHEVNEAQEELMTAKAAARAAN